MYSGTSVYTIGTGVNPSVTIDWSAASTHIIQGAAATPTTGVSIYHINQPTLTNKLVRQVLTVEQPRDGGNAMQLCWPGPTEHASGVTTQPSSTPGAGSDFLMEHRGGGSGTTVYVKEGSQEVK
jgi:hypothetical protein